MSVLLFRSNFPPPSHRFIGLPKLLVVALLILFSSRAYALIGDSYGPIGLDGSIRTTTSASLNYQNRDIFGERNLSDGFAQVTLREILSGYPKEWLSYELHAVQMLTISTAMSQSTQAFTPPEVEDDNNTDRFALSRGPILSAQGGSTAYRMIPLHWNWDRDGEGDVRPDIFLDRINLKMRLDFLDVTLGRQAVTFGKAYFWNPLDIFLAFNSTQFDRDYKQGVDALRFDLPWGDFSGINLVASLGDIRDSNADSWQESALIGRIFTNQMNWDFSLQGGKIRGGYHIGGGLTGEVATVEIRGEAAYFIQDSERAPDDHIALTVGIGRRFEYGLWLQAEYFYNGASAIGHEREDFLRNLQLMSEGYLRQFSRHLTGLVASYEILPILLGSVAWIQDWIDLSTILQPGLTYSVADEVELLAGAAIALGKRPRRESFGTLPRSEFGTYPHFFYVEAKIYF